jgi:biopolymer transport protein ExbD
MIRRGRFQRYRRAGGRGIRIPTESMADIAFLLMIFFVTTTVLRIEEGLPLDLPRAITGLRQPREQIAHVWIDADGRVMVNDRYVRYEDLVPIFSEKLRRYPQLVVAINSDQRARYAYMHRALTELKKAETVRVSFTALPRESGS